VKVLLQQLYKVKPSSNLYNLEDCNGHSPVDWATEYKEETILTLLQKKPKTRKESDSKKKSGTEIMCTNISPHFFT
jgi:hypothetical protein